MYDFLQAAAVAAAAAAAVAAATNNGTANGTSTTNVGDGLESNNLKSEGSLASSGYGSQNQIVMGDDSNSGGSGSSTIEGEGIPLTSDQFRMELQSMVRMMNTMLPPPQCPSDESDIIEEVDEEDLEEEEDDENDITLTMNNVATLRRNNSKNPRQYARHHSLMNPIFGSRGGPVVSFNSTGGNPVINSSGAGGAVVVGGGGGGGGGHGSIQRNHSISHPSSYAVMNPHHHTAPDFMHYRLALAKKRDFV